MERVKITKGYAAAAGGKGRGKSAGTGRAKSGDAGVPAKLIDPNSRKSTDRPVKRDTRQNTPDEAARARSRWHGILGKVVEENEISRSIRRDSARQSYMEAYEQDFTSKKGRGLIEELKKANQRSNVKESVLQVLKTQANLTEKQFERQKYSAKEMLRKRAARTKGITGLSLSSSHKIDENAELIAEYDERAQWRYPITPAIQEKMDKIREKREAEEEKQRRREEHGKVGLATRIYQLLGSSILGQTLRANPRFFKLDPLEHLPDLCRRCRRPLVDTLESHFTIVGILFAVFIPLVGLLMMLSNKEFVCVVCEEVYVYGDLTSRPDE